MTKFKLLLFFILFPSLFIFSQAESKTQNFIDLSMSSSLFDAFGYYEKNVEIIKNEDFVIGETFYKAFKSVALNEYDVSTPYFTEILSNFSGESRYSIAEVLLNFSLNSQKYEDAIYLCNILIEALDNNESPVAEEFKEKNRIHLSQMRDILSLLVQEPKMQICFKDSSSVVIDFDQSDNVPIIEVQVNQRATKALFDTGVSVPLVMTNQTADSIGVRKLSDQTTLYLNRTPTPGRYGILDSLNINNVTVSNIEVLIIDFDNSDKTNFDLIIGLPIIKQMGIVSLDLEHQTLTLVESVDGRGFKNNYNMLLFNGNLHMKSTINNIPHTGLIDTGSGRDEIILNKSLYEENRKEFGIIVTNYSDTNFLVNRKDIENLGTLENLKWRLPNQYTEIDISQNSRVRLNNNNQSEHYDAFYGFKFLQRFKKATFDFNRMEFSYEY